jgi:hypothetical protein
MTLQVKDRGIDFSGFRPDPATVVKDGAKFFIRYSAGAGNGLANTQWKLCGINEIKNGVAAGLDFIANSEWYATRVQEGAAAGKADGAADLTFWKSRGLNRGASIYVSWDANPDPTKWNSVDAYLKAYNAALNGYYFVDCYAGTPYLKHALSLNIIKYGWRTNAGAWNRDGLPYQPNQSWVVGNIDKIISITPAAIWQTGNYWYNKQADENVLLRANVGSHLQAVSPIIPPPPNPKPPTPQPNPPQPNPVIGEEEMYEVFQNEDGAMALIGLNRYVALNYGGAEKLYTDADRDVFIQFSRSKQKLVVSNDRFTKIAKVWANYPAEVTGS